MKNYIEKLSSPKIDKELLEQLGEEASSQYLKDGISLEDSIIKIAGTKDLNPKQIERLCEFANLKTFQDMYKKSDDKTFEFDVANVKKIIEKINSPEMKIVKQSFDVSSTGRGKDDQYLGILFPEEDLSKTAAVEFPADLVEGIPRNDVKKTGERAEKIREEATDKQNMLKFANAQLEEEVYHVVKQSILNGDLTPDEIYAVAIQRFPDNREYTKEVVDKALKRLQKEGVVDPTEQIKISTIKERLVINDNHPFIRNLKQAMINDEEIFKLGKEIESASTVISFINGKLK